MRYEPIDYPFQNGFLVCSAEGRNCIHMGLSNPGSPTNLPVHIIITATYTLKIST